jgi:lipopolysaccharide biosynthesis glycosyltransferase
MSKSIIFTLFENNYAYGVAALINSAIANNFTGKFTIGYKGNLPHWINQLKKTTDSYILPHFNHIEIEILEIKSDLHLRFYKPFLFEQLLERFPDSNIFYFDPDITIIGEWDFFEDWVNNGVGLVLDDCYDIMPYNHPIKYQWSKIFNYNILKGNTFNFYINSGFIGGGKNAKTLIMQWKQNILLLQEQGYDLTSFKPAISKYNSHKRLNPIIGDQDILNATINQHFGTTTFSIMGPEGMGFSQPSYVMLHNTGSKTWNKNFILDFFKNGVKISEANLSYLSNIDFPINIYPNIIKKYKLKFNLLITQILQRIF